MIRVMVDLETFGSGSDSAICQIGAVDFGLSGPLNAEFSVNVDAADCVKNGAGIEIPAVYWWLEQTPEARASLFPDRLTEVVALQALAKFWESADEVWSHATFDFVILMNAFKRNGINPRCGFRKSRDIRTLLALAPEAPRTEVNDVPHNALSDARYQAKYVAAALTRLGVKT